jgi:hypothetical protein
MIKPWAIAAIVCLPRMDCIVPASFTHSPPFTSVARADAGACGTIDFISLLIHTHTPARQRRGRRLQANGFHFTPGTHSTHTVPPSASTEGVWLLGKMDFISPPSHTSHLPTPPAISEAGRLGKIVCIARLDTDTVDGTDKKAGRKDLAAKARERAKHLSRDGT